MEEDPESEKEIQEFSSLKEVDQSETSMVKWILKKGYGIGKKMVITGIVISSAPVVLPPLVVFSAIGVAVSVPFGLVFASYACTNKFMNMLLPTPTRPPPLLLEYYEDDFDEKVPNLDRNGTEKQCFSIDEYEDGVRNGVVEFELAESPNNEMDGLVMNVEEEGYYSDVDERIEDIEEGVAVRFEEDDVDENLGESLGRYSDEFEEEKERVERENVIYEDEIERMEDSKGFGLDDVDVDNVDKERNNTNKIEDEEEKEQMKDMNQGVEIIVESFDVAGDEHNLTDEETIGKLGNEKPSVEIYDDEEEEEIVKESTGLLEKIRNKDRLDDGVGDSEHTSNGVFEDKKDAETPEESLIIKEIKSQKLVGNGSKNPEPVGEMRHVVVLARGNEENNFNSREVAELDLVARKVNTDGNEDAISRERLVRSNADPTEISDENGGGDHKVTIDVMARRAFKRAPSDSDQAKIVSKTDKKVPFRKDVLNDEKIWEKLEAMRAIVGFKAPRQPTCIDELKALYVFTGVELPASFKDDLDLVDVNAKLKFLMSIVGVR